MDVLSMVGFATLFVLPNFLSPKLQYSHYDIASMQKEYQIDLKAIPVRKMVQKKYGKYACSAFDGMACEYVKAGHGKEKLYDDLQLVVECCESLEVNVGHMLDFASGCEGPVSKIACRSSSLRRSVQEFDRAIES